MSRPAPILTLSYTTSSGTYIRKMLGEVLKHYRFTVVAPIILCIIGFLLAALILGDLRYALVALTILFIVVPMIVALAYFSVCLTPEACEVVLQRHLLIRPSHSITIIYEPKKRGDELLPARTPITIPWESMSDWQRDGDTTIAHTGPLTLIIPDRILPSPPHTIFPKAFI